MRQPGYWTRAARLAALVLAASLVACGDLGDAAYLRQPSPVPTLARLATTTPVPPTATAQPTQQVLPPTATVLPTPTPLLGVLAVTANIRSGPGTGYDIVGYREQGSEVRLIAEADGWYHVELPDGQRGWVAGQLLVIDEAVQSAVPTATAAP